MILATMRVSDNDANVDSDGDEEVDTRKFHGDAARLDDVDEYYDHDDDDSDEEFDATKFYGDDNYNEFDARKIHGGAAGLDDVNYYDEEFDGMRFHGVGKNYERAHDHYHYTIKYRGATHSICYLTYKTLKEIPIVFHNRSNHNYHFIIKRLAEEF